MAKITLKHIDNSIAEDAFLFVSEVFATRSTLHRAINIEIDVYRDYLKASYQQAIDQGLSIVAVDESEKEICGVLIAKDIIAKDIIASNKTTRVLQVKKLLPITKLSQKLDEIYYAQRQITFGDAMLVDMAAVSQHHGGLDIYKDMRLKAHTMAAQKGFKFVIGQLSSQRTQKIVLSELGHRNCGEIAFSQFTCDGRRPFASIKNPKSIIISEQRL
ncbi:hypothetical protein OAT72_02110 [Alphaproteobacteria bacterium]|nr:hypothetical protein [Alphaproteobacteria bacterium]